MTKEEKDEIKKYVEEVICKNLPKTGPYGCDE